MITDQLREMAAAIEHAGGAVPMVFKRLPMVAVNVTNDHSSNHWGGRHDRVKAQRQGAHLAMKASLRGVELPITVLLTLVRPRRLDDDGAVAAVKPIRDGIADALGIDDRDERVLWLPVQQRRGRVREHAVEVEVWAR